MATTCDFKKNFGIGVAMAFDLDMFFGFCLKLAAQRRREIIRFTLHVRRIMLYGWVQVGGYE